MSGEPADKINVVAYEADSVWFAQGVEYDISAWAAHFGDLPKAFDRQLSAARAVNRHLGRHGLDGIPPAPQRFRDMLISADYDVKPGRLLRLRGVAIESFSIARQEA